MKNNNLMESQSSLFLLDDVPFKPQTPIDSHRKIVQYQTLPTLALIKPLDPKYLLKNTDSTIKYVRFKVNKTPWKARARSNSPKEEIPHEKKENEAEKKEIQKADIKENLKKSAELLKELQHLNKNNIITSRGFDLCFQLFNQIFKSYIGEEFYSSLTIVKTYFEKMVFLNEKNLLKKLEGSLNKNIIFLQSLLCREIVEELCDKKSEDKEMYIQKIRSIEIEKNKLAVSLEAKKSNSIKTELLNDSLKQSRIDFLQQECDALKEKLKNMEISIQKNSTENSKLKESFQIKIEMIAVEKEEMGRNYEKALLELRENIEKLKKESIEKETEISNLKVIHDRVINDYKKMIVTMRGAKEKIANLEEKNSTLMKENQDLTIKAAVPFSELTPRPTFNKFKEIFELSDGFFQNKTTKEITEDLSKICKNYILTEISGQFLNKLKKKPKDHNEKKMSFLSLKSTSDAINPDSSNSSRSNNLLEIPGKEIEFDEIIQPKWHKPNSNLQIVIPDRKSQKNDIKEPLSARKKAKEKKNLEKAIGKIRRKYQSP